MGSDRIASRVMRQGSSVSVQPRITIVSLSMYHTILYYSMYTAYAVPVVGSNPTIAAQKMAIPTCTNRGPSTQEELKGNLVLHLFHG
jgi:hypothetical protein